MKHNDFNFLTIFSNISHAYFQIKLHDDIFHKAFTQTAKKEFAQDDHDISISYINNLSQDLFEALFLKKQKNLRMTISEIQSLIRTPYTLESFLSNYFYIVLNEYIKSFYNHRLGWKRISRFSAAIEDFIDWCQTLEHQNEENLFYLTPEDRIVANLEDIRKKKVKINVLNTYQGVPIQYKASVVHTAENCVYLKTHPIQEAAARDQKGIYILGTGSIEYDIYAQIKLVKYKGHTLLELRSFNILKESLSQRQGVRVQPKESIALTLLHAKRSFKVHLFDISLGGLAIITSQKVDIPEFTPIQIRISELLFGKTITINATFVQTSKFEENKKLHFKLNLKSSQETLLSRYIAKRQNEIIQTLKKWI
ncbi:MAG: PilZ domain-containing protein [Campylobacterota bacterium]|nr:PilZ domain-containing protein [Campylobacterota bacterium]